jgi:hypothetical protein
MVTLSQGLGNLKAALKCLCQDYYSVGSFADVGFDKLGFLIIRKLVLRALISLSVLWDSFVAFGHCNLELVVVC